MKDLQILNVVYIESGVLSSVRSFPMTKENETEQVANAEACFIETVKSLTDEFDEETVLEDGYFEMDGIYIALDWSII